MRDTGIAGAIAVNVRHFHAIARHERGLPMTEPRFEGTGGKGALLVGGLVVALGVRVLYLFVRYILGSPSAQRSGVESWALIFLAAGIAFRRWRSRPMGVTSANSWESSSFWLWALFCGLVIALYWPALSVGLLSDDFVLMTYASNWGVGPVTASLFRPIPLLVWASLLQAGAGAMAFHLVNLLLHGTNAYLTVRVVSGWVRDSKWCVLAGLLMLTAPLAPEAVVWLSGVFDLLATTFVLACILAARGYGEHPSVAIRALFVGLGLASVASKETAAVAAGLVLLDAWVRNARSRRLYIDTGILVAIVGAFSVVRLTSAFGMSTPPLDRYTLQRALFGSFGALAVPWHAELIERLPLLPILGTSTVVYLLTTFFLAPNASTHRTKLTIAASAWVLVTIIPVFPILFIAPDLQQSRYLYASSVGWAALIVVLASEPAGPFLKRLSLAAGAGLVLIASYGTVSHLGPWRNAALVRDRVEASAIEVGMARCSMVTLSNVPDSVRGAYVFRNGVVEAFARDLRVSVALDNRASGECAFRWNEARLSFVPSDAK